MRRLAVDMGGTFTDVALSDGGEVTTYKLLTTADAPERGALDGIRKAVQLAGVTLESIQTIIHGTTLATNALIERKGAKVALVTTEGFRDVLEMRFEKRFDQYDLGIEMPTPLVPRDRRLALPERMRADGTPLKVPSPADIDDLAAELESLEPEAVAIGFLHSYANPDHEALVADHLARRLGADVTICQSAEVSPEAREYERFSTVCANAYVQPLMARYLTGLDGALRAQGFAGSFLMMLSGGGVTTLEQAVQTPIRLVESGPAGGVALAAHVAAETGSDRTLALDMGGTTAKICFLEDAQPQTTRRFEVARAWRNVKGSGLPVRVPAIELVEIGAGGGSIAGVDKLGRLTMGPESAGADPGPSAYGRGGGDATVTDANILLGRVSPDGFANGTIDLQPVLSRNTIAKNVAEPLEMKSIEWAAAAMIEVSDEAMANAARVHGIELGKNVAEFDLLASGGGGPLHAARIAEKLSIRRVIVPTNAGVGSAIGFLSAPIAYESARSVMQPLDGLNTDVLETITSGLISQVRQIAGAGSLDADLDVSLWCELCYTGQGQEVRLELDAAQPVTQQIDGLVDRFNAAFAKLYRFSLPEMAVQMQSISALAKADQHAPEGNPSPVQDDRAVVGRPVFDPELGAMRAYVVHPRQTLCENTRLGGPALIAEDQTTTVVPPGWVVSRHSRGHLILDRVAS